MDSNCTGKMKNSVLKKNSLYMMRLRLKKRKKRNSTAVDEWGLLRSAECVHCTEYIYIEELVYYV